MPSFKFKKNLLIVLIGLSILLLATNIILQPKIFVSDYNEVNINREELAKRFRIILNEFGIDEKLIKETKSVGRNSGAEVPNFKVQVPKDLSIPEILQELYKSFRKDSITLNSVEKIKGGKSNLTLKIGSSNLLQAEFDYSKSFVRNLGSIAFIIYDPNPANSSTLSLIESPTKLNFLIRPDSKIIQYLDVITTNFQQYSVLIDDDISEQKYQLGPAFSERRVVNVIKSLITDFPRIECFIVDDNSDFYKSSNYVVFQRELLKRKIKLFKTSDFVNLNDDETELAQFNEKIKSLAKGNTIIFLCAEEAYLALKNSIEKYVKKGYRVIPSSLIL